MGLRFGTPNEGNPLTRGVVETAVPTRTPPNGSA
jgi:hypothetical protein